MVTVQDEGPGIPDADKEKVFEPFLRLEMSRNNETGGFGLGLAIARRIVGPMAGRLRSPTTGRPASA